MSLKFLINKRGVTIIETLLYVFILTIVMGVIVQAFIKTGGAYKNIKASREVEISGTILMDRLIRDIRDASIVIIGQSVLGTNPGSITLSGVDDRDTAYTNSFTTSSGIVSVSKNGGTAVPLTSSSTRVTYIKFTRVASPHSEAVRIELEVSNPSGPVSKSKKFYGFAVLRGSY